MAKVTIRYTDYFAETIHWGCATKCVPCED